jgi:AraC-like DNA-binding protein
VIIDFHEPAYLVLAWAMGMSRFHFLRTFARQFGLPLHAYQINQRMERIRRLLKAGVPVGEIEAGFADQSHLTRHFKRLMGVSPGQYALMAGPHRVAARMVA